jgi:hypothetical protein
VPQAVELLLRRGERRRMPVAERHHGDARREVEKAASVGGDEVGSTPVRVVTLME